MVGMLLISAATARAGPVMTATVLSSVPLLSAVLAALLLDERVSRTTWIGIGIATAGILFTIFGTAKRARIQPQANSLVRS